MNTYKSIRLSEEQKHKMARSIQQPSKKKKKLNARFFIYPAFIVTALFFIFLWSNGNTTQPITVHQATDEVFDRDGIWTHDAFVKKIIVLWIVSLVILMATYVMLLITANNPKNSIYFQSIRYVNEKMKSRKMFGVAVTPIVILVVYTFFVLITSWPILVLQAVIFLLSVSLYFYLSVFCLRKLVVEHKCPSCQKELTNREIAWSKKCGSCKNKFDVRAIVSFQPGLISIFISPFVLNKMDFNRYFIIGYFILIVLATIKVSTRNVKIEQPK